MINNELFNEFCYFIFTVIVHTEAVAGIVGRADSGAALFFLLSLMSYIKYCKHSDNPNKSWTSSHAYLYISLILAGLSMLTKEHGVTVLALCAVYHVIIHHKIFSLSSETLGCILTEVSFDYISEISNA